MAFDGLEFVGAGVAAVAVHDEGDVLGYGTALEGADEEVAQVEDEGFDGREGEGPAAEVGAVYVCHGCGGGWVMRVGTGRSWDGELVPGGDCGRLSD